VASRVNLIVVVVNHRVGNRGGNYVLRGKAFPIDGFIRLKPNQKVLAGRSQHIRQLIAAISTKERSGVFVTVVDLDIIVSAVHLVLDFEGREPETDVVTFLRRGQRPVAIFVVVVVFVAVRGVGIQVLISRRGHQVSAAHGAIHRLKAFPLDGGVRVKPHKESIRGGENGMRQFTAAKPTQNLSVFGIAVVQFAMIIAAFLMRLHLKVVELELDAMTGCRGEMPSAVFTARVKIGPIGTAYLSLGIRNFVLTTAFLAVHLILVQREPVVAMALERSDGIFTNVLATAVLNGALVAIREKERLEPRLLDGIVRIKLDAHEIRLGGDDGRQRRAAKHAVDGGVAGSGGATTGKRRRIAEDDVAADVRMSGWRVMRRRFPAPYFQRIVFAVLIVALQIEMGKIESDSVLRGRLDLPHAVLVGRIQLGKRG